MWEVITGLVVCQVVGNMGVVSLLAGFALGMLAAKKYPTVTTQMWRWSSQKVSDLRERLVNEIMVGEEEKSSAT